MIRLTDSSSQINKIDLAKQIYLFYWCPTVAPIVDQVRLEISRQF